MALGGESSTLVLSSMECFTLGYDGWRCSIPTAVALSGKTRRVSFSKSKLTYLSVSLGIPEPTQVMPPMGMQRVFPAVASADYTIFVIGTNSLVLPNIA